MNAKYGVLKLFSQNYSKQLRAIPTKCLIYESLNSRWLQANRHHCSPAPPIQYGSKINTCKPPVKQADKLDALKAYKINVRLFVLKSIGMCSLIYGVKKSGAFDEDTTELQDKVTRSFKDFFYPDGHKEMISKNTICTLWNDFIITMGYSILVGIPKTYKMILETVTKEEEPPVKEERKK